MDGTGQGEAGVIAWCNMIRSTMAKDPGRAFLDMQIQKQGFDFLDNYLETVTSRSQEEPVYALLKTPARKRDPSKKTKAISVPKIDYENDARHLHNSPLQPAGKAVPIADARDDLETEMDEPVQEEALNSTPPPSLESLPPAPAVVPQPVVTSSTPPEPTLDSLPPTRPDTAKDLSIIAEDDERALEHSHLSDEQPPTNELINGDLTVPIRDAAPPATMLKRKPSTSLLTGLSAPSPLRKSTRLSREPSMGASSSGASGLAHTPGTGLGGKRTSWLKKAKEVKALEMIAPGKIPGVREQDSDHGLANGSGAVLSGGNKRKSEDMLGLHLTMAKAEALIVGEERKFKVPRIEEATAADSGSKGESDSSGEQRRPASPFAPKIEPFSPVDASSPVLGHVAHVDSQPATSTSYEDFTAPLPEQDTSEEGVLTRFKRAVEGFGARAGKSMGKSLGGNAAAALAEARAAAEARVLERNKEDGVEMVVETQSAADDVIMPSPSPKLSEVPLPITDSHPTDQTRRLSVSDLVTSHDDKREGAESVFAFKLPSAAPQPLASRVSSVPGIGDASTSTTPPHSPPASKRGSGIAAPPRVFSKPPAVFVPPPPGPPSSKPDGASSAAIAAAPSKDFSFKLPAPYPFTLPAAMSLGVPASLPSPPHLSAQKQSTMLSTQSSKGSVLSEAVFDKERDVPAWMPATQDTAYSTQPSQSRSQHQQQHDDLDDDDDSWHVDDKFKSNQMWTPFGFASADKDDTMTWSTLPSRSTSQKGGDTQPMQVTQNFTGALQAVAGNQTEDDPADPPNKGAFDFESDMENAEFHEADLAMDIDADDSPLESELDDIIAAGKSTITLIESKSESDRRSQSQQSMASTSSSQSQLGFVGQVSKLYNSVFTGSKKGKQDAVKSIPLAAAAAKKQHEEAEKKAARLKTMENRRQLALQRKAEEEKARALEEGKKIKEETDRRKREREEHTDKRALRSTTAKKPAEDDTTKKRKVAEEKKPDTKKPPSKDSQPPRLPKAPSLAAPGTATKPSNVLKSALKQPSSSSVLPSAMPLLAPSSSNPKIASSTDSKTVKAIQPNSKPSMAKGKGKAQSNDDLSDMQPGPVASSQTANRSKAQIPAAQPPRQPPVVPSESIELPDINSEYSDSEDEDRPRTFDPPEWAQPDQLNQQLQEQSRMNPDDIFGRIGPLRMEEIFRTRQSRFRARTSSANWSGPDQLTAQEEREYARRMGFR